ncbi:hypothetical protein C8Q77DRAFT_279950 [Trametes polyzona]|nr:hypothetical protein C8Q77DRAFT_279950 [Trametes polyzona]
MTRAPMAAFDREPLPRTCGGVAGIGRDLTGSELGQEGRRALEGRDQLSASARDQRPDLRGSRWASRCPALLESALCVPSAAQRSVPLSLRLRQPLAGAHARRTRSSVGTGRDGVMPAAGRPAGETWIRTADSGFVWMAIGGVIGSVIGDVIGSVMGGVLGLQSNRHCSVLLQSGLSESKSRAPAPKSRDRLVPQVTMRRYI